MISSYRESFLVAYPGIALETFFLVFCLTGMGLLPGLISSPLKSVLIGGGGGGSGESFV